MLKQFDSLAKKQGFNRKVKDTTPVGYYYVNKVGDALLSYPGFHKKGKYIKL